MRDRHPQRMRGQAVFGPAFVPESIGFLHLFVGLFDVQNTAGIGVPVGNGSSIAP
jgi:hypothetical protein